jgi:hypothetical protein
MSPSPQSHAQSVDELTNELRSVVESIRKLQESEPVEANLSADEADTLRGFVAGQMMLQKADGGVPPSNPEYGVLSQWIEYQPDGGSRLFELRRYKTGKSYRTYSKGLKGDWREEPDR